jgi:hypothetical protein
MAYTEIHVSRVSITEHFCFLHHSLWMSGSTDNECMDSHLIDVASLLNVPQQQSHAYRNANMVVLVKKI